MTRLNAVNNGQTALTASISDSDTSFYVNDGDVLPDAPFVITVENEIMRVDAKTGNLYSSVIRGYEDTTAAAHDAETVVKNCWTAGMLNALYTNNPINKLDATTDPTIDNDSSEGYAIGSIWVNTTTPKTFTCLDATEGAAVWGSGSTIDYDYGAAPDAGGSDSYTITLDPAPAAYAAGQHFWFKANTPNTGAATLNINSLGAKTLKKDYNTDLETGDILAGQYVHCIYDGTNMQVIGITGASSATANKVTRRDASGYLYTINRAPALSGVWATQELILRDNPFAIGETATSSLAVGTYQIFLLTIVMQTGTNNGDTGLYLISKFGETAVIDAIVTNSLVTVALNASYHITITNTSGIASAMRANIIGLL